MDIAPAPQQSLENELRETRAYLLDCLKFRQRPKETEARREAARAWRELLSRALPESSVPAASEKERGVA